MRIRAAATTIALLLVLAAEAAGQTERPPLLGIVWGGSGTEIAKLDALTLRPVSESVRVNEPSWFVARSPSGNRAAFAVGRLQDRLRFLDLQRMRFVGGLRLPGAIGTLWRDPRRLVVVAGGDPTAVFVVDPLTRRARRTHYLDGSVTALARSAGRLVLLLAPRGRIGPARVAVVGAGGAVRELKVPGVRAGFEVVDQSNYTMRQEAPGLAVDPSGRRAVIVPAVGPVAEVDLATFTIALHVTKERSLAARQKQLVGWRRSATWFGPDLIAVSGSDTSSMKQTPAGVTLIDARDWTTRSIEPLAWSVAVAGDTLVACGSGLSGYAADGTKRFHLLEGDDVPSVQVLGGYVYVAADNNTRYTIVNPELGTVVGSVRTTSITTLAG